MIRSCTFEKAETLLASRIKQIIFYAVKAAKQFQTRTEEEIEQLLHDKSSKSILQGNRQCCENVTFQRSLNICDFINTGLNIRAGSRRSSPASLSCFAGYFHCFTSLNMSRRWTNSRLLFTKLRLLKNAITVMYL